MMGLVELDSRGRLGVARVFDDAFMVADERWLGQLEDIPGAFLKARISHEFKRRQKAREAGQ
jgi:Ca-activated chloride channel family protein